MDTLVRDVGSNAGHNQLALGPTAWPRSGWNPFMPRPDALIKLSEEVSVMPEISLDENFILSHLISLWRCNTKIP